MGVDARFRTIGQTGVEEANWGNCSPVTQGHAVACQASNRNGTTIPFWTTTCCSMHAYDALHTLNCCPVIAHLYLVTDIAGCFPNNNQGEYFGMFQHFGNLPKMRHVYNFSSRPRQSHQRVERGLVNHSRSRATHSEERDGAASARCGSRSNSERAIQAAFSC